LLEAGALSVDIHDFAADTPRRSRSSASPARRCPVRGSATSSPRCFEPGVDPHAVVAGIADALAVAVPQVILGNVEEQDWVRLTQAQFAPIRISGRMWILPSWHQAVEPEAINLVIDPGLAFGTGSHPTTRLCLQWLEAHLQPGERVLDYGCGSGILAIAAKASGRRARRRH
jgi:ribosomal protein L11 methyltransferase